MHLVQRNLFLLLLFFFIFLINASALPRCASGYQQNRLGLCEDIDECSTGIHRCEQLCTNRLGSYSCSCNKGFVLESDQCSCKSADVCASSGCTHGCIEAKASSYYELAGYMCTCPGKLRLGRDMKTCVTSCSVNNGNCAQICSETYNGVTCSCRPGFVLNEDKITCNDQDECLSRYGTSCSQLCVNLYGSSTCGCFPGFTLAFDGKTCVDVNECHASNGGCSHYCLNSPGGFMCTCPPGFQLIQGGYCEDINECHYRNGGCEQICTNLPGAFECSCEQGYVLDSKTGTCQDKNECLMETGGCVNATCVNIPGGFECECFPGYSSDPSNPLACIELNMCDALNQPCVNGTCIPSLGSFSCECPSGLQLDTMNSSVCIDINECNFLNGGCSDTCINYFNGSDCACLYGREFIPYSQSICQGLPKYSPIDLLHVPFCKIVEFPISLSEELYDPLAGLPLLFTTLDHRHTLPLAPPHIASVQWNNAVSDSHFEACTIIALSPSVQGIYQLGYNPLLTQKSPVPDSFVAFFAIKMPRFSSAHNSEFSLELGSLQLATKFSTLTCSIIDFDGKFSTAPLIVASLNRKNYGRYGAGSLVPVTMWIEKITSVHFTVCVAVVAPDPYQGLVNVFPLSLDYAAFLYTPKFAVRSGEFSFGAFKSTTDYNATPACRLVLFDSPIPESFPAPVVIATPNTGRGIVYGDESAISAPITTWLEEVNYEGFRVCISEISTPAHVDSKTTVKYKNKTGKKEGGRSLAKIASKPLFMHVPVWIHWFAICD